MAEASDFSPPPLFPLGSAPVAGVGCDVFTLDFRRVSVAGPAPGQVATALRLSAAAAPARMGVLELHPSASL